MFELRGLGFSVPGRTLLDDVSVVLRSHQVTGLIGHNGSGKSTLIKLLARQLRPSHGTVEFRRRAIKDWPIREFARNLAYLPQTPPSAAGLLVCELVAFGRYPWRGALGRLGPADHRAIEQAMASTDVIRFADQQVETLSGGERQRVWIAMLIAQDADCLLLDEPISALDVSHQVEVLSLVRQLATERGLGVVVVLHDINMAARYCDELVALRGGRLVAQGSPQQIVTPEQLQEIYGVTMGVMPHPDTGEPLSFVRQEQHIND
ncbi:ABC transporter ATP-binding protein [Paraburkholderia sp.]|uniref:ABC transporter ATP-binding protein n=1 Tax=Paraburkholderia sp. TaxID=1926495 RepID=UPI0039E2156B